MRPYEIVTPPPPESPGLASGGPRDPLVPKAWIFTFGLDHPLRKRYVRIRGSEEAARTLMTQIFGQGNWAGIYSEDMASQVIDRGRLTELDLG